jgi:hypothetical protein
VTRRELLAIRHFHHYLLGARFVVRTDHNSLVWLCHFRELDGQLARWLETLAQYDFEIIHRKGKQHGNADGLSRRPCAEIGCKHCDKAELMEYSVNFVEAAVNWIPYKELSSERYEATSQDTLPGRERDGDATVTTTCVDGEHGMQSEGKKVCEGGKRNGKQPVETEIQGSGRLGESRRDGDKGRTESMDGRVDGCSDLGGGEVGADASTSQRSIGNREGVRRVCPVQEAGQGLRHNTSSVNEHVELMNVLGSRKDLINAQRTDPNIGPVITLLELKQKKPEAPVTLGQR